MNITQCLLLGQLITYKLLHLWLQFTNFLDTS